MTNGTKYFQKKSSVPVEKIEKGSNATVLDNYFGFDVRKSLQKIEKELTGITLEIVIEPKEPPSSDSSERAIKFRFMDECRDTKATHPEGEDINKLLDRIEVHKKNYENILNKATAKLEEVQNLYNVKDYKITLIKRRSQSEIQPNRSSDTSEPVAVTSKRKTSLNKEVENEQVDKRQCVPEFPKLADPFSDMLVIGPNGTKIPRKDYEGLHWKDAAGGTRELCNLIFGENILATHSLTGNQSPAFRGRERPTKGQLDPLKTADITYLVCSKFNVSQQLVRATITTKCADSTKKIKRLALKAPSNC